MNATMWISVFLFILGFVNLAISQSSSVTPRYGHTATIVDNTLYIIGGNSDQSTFISEMITIDLTQSFNTTDPDWVVVNSKDIPKVSGHSAVAGGASLKEIVVFGGQAPMPMAQKSLFVYSTANNTWDNIQLPQEPVRRYHHSAIANATGHMIVFGGMIDSSVGAVASYVPDDYWVFDTVMLNQWGGFPCISTTPGRRQRHTASVIGTRMFVIGGMSENGNLTDLDDLYVYDMISAVWSSQSVKGPIPKARCDHSAVVYKDTIVIYGGTAIEGDAFGDVAVLNTTSLSWTLPDTVNPPPPRWKHTASIFGDNMLVAFGRVGAGADSHMYILTISNWTWINVFGSSEDPARNNNPTNTQPAPVVETWSHKKLWIGLMAGAAVLITALLAIIFIILRCRKEPPKQTFEVIRHNSRYNNAFPPMSAVAPRNRPTSIQVIDSPYADRFSVPSTPLTPGTPATPGTPGTPNSLCRLLSNWSPRVSRQFNCTSDPLPSPSLSSDGGSSMLDVSREMSLIRGPLERFAEGFGRSLGSLDQIDGIDYDVQTRDSIIVNRLPLVVVNPDRQTDLSSEEE